MLPTAARSGRSPAARNAYHTARAHPRAHAADGWDRPGQQRSVHGVLRPTCWPCWQHRSLDAIRKSTSLAPLQRVVVEVLRARGWRLSSMERAQGACGQLAGRTHLHVHIWAIAAFGRCVRLHGRSCRVCSRCTSQTYRRAQRKHARTMVAATSMPERILTVEARPRRDLRTGACEEPASRESSFFVERGAGDAEKIQTGTARWGGPNRAYCDAVWKCKVPMLVQIELHSQSSIRS